jgi:hypothetical protein
MWLKPAAECAKCGGPFDAWHGNRVISRGDFWISVVIAETGAPELDLRGSAWTEDARRRAREQLSAGLHPWVCQRCLAGPFCGKCGFPLQLAFGADVIKADDATSHQAILPVSGPCLNNSCANGGKGHVE